MLYGEIGKGQSVKDRWKEMEICHTQDDRFN